MCAYFIYRYPNFVNILIFVFGNIKLTMLACKFLAKLYNDNMFKNKIYRRVFNKD